MSPPENGHEKSPDVNHQGLAALLSFQRSNICFNFVSARNLLSGETRFRSIFMPIMGLERILPNESVAALDFKVKSLVNDERAILHAFLSAVVGTLSL